MLIVDDVSEVNHWIGRGREPFRRATEPYPRGAADSMFRDAMGDVGVDRLRRWIMWGGVSLATFWKELPEGWRRIQALARAVVLGVLAIFVGLYLLPNLVLDLLDVGGWGTWHVPGMGERPWLEELGGALGILLVLSIVGTALLAIGTRKAAYWQVGAMFVPTIFLLGWLIVFSYLQNLLFKARLLFPGRSAVVASPVNQTAPEGTMATFEAGVELKKGHTLHWVEETPDGTVTPLAQTGSQLEIMATPDKDGATYRVEIYEGEELIDQSFAATLTLDDTPEASG